MSSRFFTVFLLFILGFSFVRAEGVLEKGIWDLRQADFNVINEGSGELFFDWESLTTDYPSPDTDLVLFPFVWQDQKVGDDRISAFGYGTFQCIVLLPQELVGNTELAFGMADAYSSYELYVNDELIGANGVVGTSKSEYTPYWKPQSIHFTPQNDTLVVSIQVSNYDHSKGGLREPILLGSAQAMDRHYLENNAYDYVLMGCLLMGGLFFLGLYLFGRNEASMLLFSLFCIVYSYRIIGAKNYSLHYLFEDIPWRLSIAIEYATLFLSGVLFITYNYFLYPKEFNKTYFRVAAGICLIFCVITALLPAYYFTQLLIPFFIVVLITTPYFFYMYIRAVQHRRDGALIALISAAAIVMSFSYDILAYMGFFTKNNLIIFFSYISFFFLQSLILSFRFAKSHKTALHEAEQAAIAKTNFLSTMSHEIRTPLNAVIGMSNLLKVSGEQSENLVSLKYSAQSLLWLINDILDFTKIDAGKVEFEKINTNLPDTLRNLFNSYKQNRSSDAMVEYKLEIDKELPQHISCDRLRLIQVLSNLLNNAVKFTKAGAITLEAKCLNISKHIVTIDFAVEDTGIGIPTSKHREIFNIFTQASSSTTRKYGGTGLGLSITKKLLNLQGSEIRVSSQEGVGSRFSFVQKFDLSSEQGQTTVTKAERSEEGLLVGKKILLVEDNQMNILVAKRYLEKWKVEVEVAESGFEALEKYSDHDLILMDLQMPEMDGYTACRKLREKGTSVPIVALTAAALMEVREKVLQSGMNDYVTKPFIPEELYAKLVKHTTLAQGQRTIVQ